MRSRAFFFQRNNRLADVFTYFFQISAVLQSTITFAESKMYIIFKR